MNFWYIIGMVNETHQKDSNQLQQPKSFEFAPPLKFPNKFQYYVPKSQLFSLQLFNIDVLHEYEHALEQCY